MRKQHRLRVAGSLAVIVTLALVLSALGLAQGGDTPIVILDGSLNIQSSVPWSQYTGAGDVKAHPGTAKSVTSVVLTVKGQSQTIPFNAEACIVDITYAGSHIYFRTGKDGKGLTMEPYSAFQPGSNANFLTHKNAHEKIAHVTITKALGQVFDSDATGATKITIHYR